jgi:septum formation protein
VILASASPRRAELLRAAGIEFDVRPADVDESVRHGERAEHYALRVAHAKAEAVARTMPDALVLGADTVVVVADAILGKPADPEDAARMLRLLSGRPHVVLTAVALVRPGPLASGRAVVESGVERTTVELARMTEDEIAWYVASGEPMDKAGAYAIQGLASRFVTRIEGSYSNVVGLPVALVYALLKGGGGV